MRDSVLTTHAAAFVVLTLVVIAPPVSATDECDGDNATLRENIYVCSGSDLVEADYFERLRNTPDLPTVEPDRAAEVRRSEDDESLQVARPASRTNEGTAYLDRAILWTEANTSARVANGLLQIEVCWVNPRTSDDDETAARSLVEQALDDSWNTESDVHFTGWGRCLEDEKGGVRILIADEGPRAYVGRAADTKSVSMWLNFTFDNWSKACANRDEKLSPITWERCVYSIAVHEFGHILGFFHEHDRLFHGVKYHLLTKEELADRLAACAARGQTGPTSSITPEDPILTVYDESSVMNYCFEIYDHFASLSVEDVGGAASAYGNGN